MILVMLRVMALRLWRDPAGLALVFVLPPLVFVVFASVFSGGASGRVDVHAGVVDRLQNPDSRRLVDSLRRRLNGRLTQLTDLDALWDAVASGAVDAGLALQDDLVTAPTPAIMLVHPGRKAAGEVLTAQLSAAMGHDLPELMLRRESAQLAPLLALTPDQQRRLSNVPKGLVPPPPFAAQHVLPGGDPLVIYYAGGVSVLFLMFTAMQGAMSLIDERRSGLRLRLGLSTGGVAPLLGGRMLWLVLLGAVQALVLFAVAATVYGVTWLPHLAPWAATAICAAAASGGIALALAAACQTREQAQPISTFVFLILAAVGGSMAPRFLMPTALQQLGWFTPHSWVIEAYQTVLWRGLMNGTVLAAWAILAGFAAVGFLSALVIESRRRL
jgi:ABC-2 type transport system permease protein